MEKLADRAFQAEKNRLLSHDLRSAVSDIVGGALLVEQESLSPNNKIQIARISAAADMILRLLDAIKGGEDALETPFVRPVFVALFLGEIERRWLGRVADLAIELRFNIAVPSDCCLTCVPLDLERILSNLLDNAVKFSPKGGKIILDAQEENGFLRLQVKDQGPGFSAAARELLFSYEGRPEHSVAPGSGLGLYIVRQLTRQFQGEVEVGAPDVGACVTVLLPLKQSGVVAEHPAGPDMSAAQLQGLRVLLAEDNKTNQMVARHMLELLGAEVSLAEDGIMAWEILCKQKFDVVLLDIEMPRKSGIELIRDIRTSDRPFCDMPLVALTAYFLADHQTRIMEAGANGVIAKPLTDIDALGAAINGFCVGGAAIDKTISPVDAGTYNNLKETMGQTAFAGLVDKLLIDLQGVQTRLKRAFVGHDQAQLRSASHVLISLAGAVGALELLKAAQSLNTAMHSVESVDLASCERPILLLLDELIAYLESVRNEIDGG